jgi:hypothetical protein
MHDPAGFHEQYRLGGTMPAATPIACTLSPAELRADRGALLPGLVAHAIRYRELPRGMRFHFEPTAERLRQIADVARRELQCCAFLEFKVGLALGRESLTLDVTGPADTARFLWTLLAIPAAA